MDAMDALDKLDKLECLEEEEESDGDDDARHKNLLSSIGVKPDTDKTKFRRPQRSEAVGDVSIYSLNVGSKVKAKDLVKGLKETVNVNLLKKSLGKVEDSKHKLNALLPKITADKVERDAAYEASSEKVSRWDDVVKRNRKAEQLSFPLKHENMHIHTVEDFVQKFKPKTPLEQQIYALLKGNKYEEQSESGLSRAEEEALKSVSIQEARRRRTELQKHRALLSYHEAKNRRLGKIKSRRHLRIIRKQKQKKSAAEFEELQRKDPEGAAEKIQQADKTRAEERAVLRHRQGSKWAKNRMLMAKYNEMTKVHLQEQKKLHGDLTRKNVLKIDSSDDDSDEEKRLEPEPNALVSPTSAMPSIYLPKDNPWLRHTEKKEKSEEDTEEAESQPDEIHTRSRDAILGLETVTQTKKDDSGDDSEDGGEDELKTELIEIKERRKLREELDEDKNEIHEENIKNFKAAFANLQKEGKKSLKTTENHSEEEMEERNGEMELEISTERKKNLRDMERVLETEEDVSTLTELHQSSQKTVETKKDVPKLQYIDPNKVFTLETQTIKSAEPMIVEDEDVRPRTEKDTNRMTIQEAFADDDVLGDFIAEKNKAISDSKPKALDLTLPGWGEWGGIDVKPSRRKKRRFFIKPRPPPPRKDDHLGPVIMSEKRDVYIAKHQVIQIPYPYTSVEQYERSIRQPIGQTWNTPSTFRKLTQPKVRTVMGAIIDPLDEDDAFDNTKPQKRRRVLQEDGHVGFDDVTDTSVGKRHFKRKQGNKKHKK